VNDRGRAADAVGIADGGAAEFHDAKGRSHCYQCLE
jgi:hypothetical protein